MTQRFGGRYELISPIGSGGMGSVFEAVDRDTGRMVAAKLMIASGELELQTLLRFQQEGAVLATLHHPNIVTVYGTFLEDQACAIVMERLAGGSLGTRLQQKRPSLLQTKQIVLQVLSALEYAHTRGIVHRDIKPDNIMLLPDGRVKVTDFGIARVLQAGGTLNTATGTSIGTPLYMSPEQIEGSKVDGRSDLYSLGVVLYQMVTGRPPFEGDEPLTIAFKHVHKAPPPPRDLNIALPAAWEAVILRALAKSPQDRFQTAATMRDAVEQLPTTPTEDADRTPPLPAPSPEPVAQREVAARAGPVGETPQGEDHAGAAVMPQPAPARTAAPRAHPLPSIGTGLRTRWVIVSGAGVLVLVLLVAAVVFRGLHRAVADKPVRVTVRAASGTLLPAFQLRNLAEGQSRSVTPKGSTVRFSLSPGQYRLTPADQDTYLDPAIITVRSGGPQTIHFDILFGRLLLQPPAGQVAAPGFELLDRRTGKSVHSVDGTQATQGVVVLAGHYTVWPWPSTYVSRIPVTIHPRHQTTLNLARLLGQLTVVPLTGAPPSGFDFVEAQTQRARFGADPGPARQGVFVPVGRYQLRFYNSDVYVDPVAVTIQPGGHTRIDLNTLFAAVRVPAVKTDYSVTYTWREGGVPRTLQALTKAHTYYLRAGTYRLQIDAPGSSRVVTVRTHPGRVTPLPAQ